MTKMLDLPVVGSRSYWLDEALKDEAGEACPPLRGTVTADVCIVGGGFAGLWTAYELTARDPSLGIVLLEADICGAGGSGANGGFFSSSWTELSELCTRFGEDAGVRWATALGDEVDELDAWVAAHDARIESHHEGILYAQAGEWQAGPDDEALALLSRRRLAERLKAVDAAEARRVADSPRFTGGVFTPDLATVQPARLARELRRVVLERGVRIHERTPMRRVAPSDPVNVETPVGRVRAGTVVLAHGAWAAAQPQFRRAFAVAADFMVVTEPVPELLQTIGWTTHAGIADRRELLYYLRRTHDDRIAIGGGGMGIVYGGRIGGRALTAPRLVEVAARGLIWLFPQLAGVRFERAWSGPMDITRSGLPFFVRVHGGRLVAGLGFSGHGLTSTKLGGKILASLATGADNEFTSLPVVGALPAMVPPEPFRWPLVRMAEWAYESGDRAQERGRRRGVVRGAVARAVDRYSRAGARQG
jgi:glycine/D-amino acid oxidase-like deaminating enzyme